MWDRDLLTGGRMERLMLGTNLDGEYAESRDLDALWLVDELGGYQLEVAVDQSAGPRDGELELACQLLDHLFLGQRHRPGFGTRRLKPWPVLQPRWFSYDWYETEARILEALKADLGEDSTEWKWLQKVVRWDAPDLDEATTEQVLNCFGRGNVARDQLVNDTALTRTYIWQRWIKIQHGTFEAVMGNIRSLWYQVIQPFYQYHQLLSESNRALRSPGSEVEDTMTDNVGLFVAHRIFEYKGAFQFQPGMSNLSRRGRDTPKLLFFTEKEGLVWLCDWIYKSVETISTMASNGQPSFVNLEYFAEKLKAKFGKLVIGAFCDWDPWGYMIAEQIDAKMRFLGEKLKRMTPPEEKRSWGWDVETYMLTSPQWFTQQQIATAHDLSNMPPKFQKTVNDWVGKVGTINGKPLALHIDLISTAYKKQIAERFVEYGKDGQLERVFNRVEPVGWNRVRARGRNFRWAETTNGLRR